MASEVFQIPTTYREATRPHIAEWFGHRVFPTVSGTAAAMTAQVGKRCPFLSDALDRSQLYIKVDQNNPAKTANSEGVCTISATSNGVRQDWMVCPVRALDDELLEAIVRRLYHLPPEATVTMAPAPALAEPDRSRALIEQVGKPGVKVFTYIQNKLGGEIRLQGSAASPQMSFDTTVVELLPANDASALPGPKVRIGRYGIVELQTTDTHGSYVHAVTALRNGLDLHPTAFHRQLAENPEWSRRRVEGPNVSNVFKRTFYQVAFKFQVTTRETSVGCVLALPKPVWDSWRPFLGDPELRLQSDGTWRMLDDDSTTPNNWIYVFDIADEPGSGGRPAPVEVRLVIGTDAATLTRAALEVAPAVAVEGRGDGDAVAAAITDRLRRFAPSLVLG